MGPPGSSFLASASESVDMLHFSLSWCSFISLSLFVCCFSIWAKAPSDHFCHFCTGPPPRKLGQNLDEKIKSGPVSLGQIWFFRQWVQKTKCVCKNCEMSKTKYKWKDEMADQSGKTNKVWWRQTARGGGDRQVKGGDHYQPLSGHFYRGRGRKMMMVKKEKEKGLVSKSKEVTPVLLLWWPLSTAIRPLLSMAIEDHVDDDQRVKDDLK